MYIVYIFLICKALTTRWHIFLFVTTNWLCKIKYAPPYCHHIVFDFICGIVFTNKLNNIFASSKNWCVLVNADITCKVIFWSWKVDSASFKNSFHLISSLHQRKSF